MTRLSFKNHEKWQHSRDFSRVFRDFSNVIRFSPLFAFSINSTASKVDLDEHAAADGSCFDIRFDICAHTGQSRAWPATLAYTWQEM